MSTGLPTQPPRLESLQESVAHELKELRSHWWWFLILGLLLIVGGTLALTFPHVASVGITMLLGAVLIISGMITVIGAFWAGRWSAFFLQLLVGILYLMAGMVIRDVPLESTAVLTLFIAAAFVVVGIFRVIVSLMERFPQWGWSLLNGIVTLAAGLIIYDNFPSSALWLIGLIVGLDLIFNGWTWVMLSLSLRNLAEEDEAEVAAVDTSV